MVTGRHFAILALLIPCALAVQVRGSNPGPSAITEQQRGEAVFLDALSIPCPGEVFVALNKACRPNWATLVTPATAPVTTDRSQLALVVGILAANGYIAVEAQDGQQVRNVGREIMAVAKSLGVSQSLMGRGNSLMEFAENNAWEALADELEATENEVKATMVEQKDHDLVTLTSAAAWVMGLKISTGVVQGSETLQGLEIIRQPDLARHLCSQLDHLPPRIKEGSLVVAVRQALESASALLVARGLSPEQERGNLKRINEECAAVVKAILTSTMVSSPTPAASSPSPAAANHASSNAVTPVKP